MTYLAWNRYSLRKIKGDWKTESSSSEESEIDS